MNTALTQDDIRAQVSAESFRRGEPYFQRGAVRVRRTSGAALRAQCEGSRAEPYRVEVELGGSSNPISSAHCTCPVGADGTCKHVAATLLAWVEDPESFIVVEELEHALRERSREELEAMIRYMMRRVPELEMALQMQYPVSEPRHGPINVDAYRSQVDMVFRENAAGLGAASQVADELRPLLEIASGFMTQEDYAACVQIYSAVLDGVLAHFQEVRDDEGFLSALLQECLERSASCLQATGLVHATRHDLLSTLATLAMDPGPAQERASELMLHATSRADRQELALHVRQRLRARDEDDTWLLLELEAPELGLEDFITRARTLGRADALVARLLDLDRVSDAVTELESAQDSSLFLGLIEEFARRGHASDIEDIVRHRYASSGDLSMLGWLQRLYVERGDEGMARSTAESRFYRQPSLEIFGELRDLQRDPDAWSMTRPSLLAHLRERDQWPTLIRVLLSEDDIDGAHTALDDARRTNPHDGWYALQVEIADRARETRPRTAIRLYQRLAEDLIERRSVSSFKSAAELLVRAFHVTQEREEASTWDAYLKELLDRYGRFQGLIEALQAAGLVV